jgi:hypothetical protein
VARKIERRTRRRVPIIVEKIPPCLPISSGEKKINSRLTWGAPLKNIIATITTNMPTVKNAWKLRDSITILSIKRGLILTLSPSSLSRN